MAAKHNLFGFTWKLCFVMVGPLAGYTFGAYLEHLETLRMTSYRDKSALYGKPPSERKEPSWPITWFW